MSFLALIMSMVVQNPLGQVGPSVNFGEAGLRLSYYEYGDCVVNRYPKQASEALLTNIDDEKLIRRKGVLIISDCIMPVKGTMRMMMLQADRVRYAIADALVKRELANRPVPRVSAIPALEHWDTGPAPSAVSPAGKNLGKAEFEAALRKYREKSAFTAFSRFGECVVRADAQAAKALLATWPESKPEVTAFQQLRPALAGCLPQGQTIAFTKLSLRGTVAVNYYRLAAAARGMGLAR